MSVCVSICAAFFELIFFSQISSDFLQSLHVYIDKYDTPLLLFFISSEFELF